MFGVGVTLVAAQTGSADKGQGLMKDGTVTVSGCVAAGKDADQFMLTNAMKSDGMMGKPMEDKDKMKPMAEGHMMSYELVGGTNVKAHLGHKVEITGTLSKMDMDRMTKMEKEPMAKTSDKDMNAMKLNVTSLKMVSATCP